MAATVTTVKINTCSKHGSIPWDFCEQCQSEKCEHGKQASEQCNLCNADQSWATAPITDDELERIKRNSSWGNIGTAFRLSVRPRDYRSVDLLAKLLAEYEQLRAQAKKA
jgi:hypothetical protein